MTTLAVFCGGPKTVEKTTRGIRHGPGGARCFEPLSALARCGVSRRHAPTVFRAFWEVPWLEADDTHKALSQVVSAEGAEIVVGYAVLMESRKGALPWKALFQLAPGLKRQAAPLKQLDFAVLMLLYRDRLERFHLARTSVLLQRVLQESPAASSSDCNQARFPAGTSALAVASIKVKLGSRIPTPLDPLKENMHKIFATSKFCSLSVFF